MKKLLFFLIIINFLPSVMADEILNTVKPEQKFNDNRASVSVQKQPSWETFQRKREKNNWFCIIVQVNGKIRDKIETASGQTNDELTKLALNSEKTKQFMDGKTVVKTIVVPDKIVNIVVK